MTDIEVIEFFFTTYRPYQGAFGPTKYTINPFTYEKISSLEEAKELALRKKADLEKEPGGIVKVTWGVQATVHLEEVG